LLNRRGIREIGGKTAEKIGEKMDEKMSEKIGEKICEGKRERLCIEYAAPGKTHRRV
jgi:hypothetical protein